MNSVTLQKQVRDNAEELQNYLKDLTLWNKEMKRKEVEFENTACYSKEIPPVRSKTKKVKNSQDNISKEKNQRISAFDYSSWEKFDTEKACNAVDADSSQSESELEVPPQVQYRLREEASFEKEKGNQYVKSQKWHEAIKCYTHAIKCYPYDGIFYANRALCFLNIKDFRAAETDCTCALQLDKTYVKAYQRRAAARAELNQVQQAIEDLRKVLEFEPNNTVSKKELAKLEKKNVVQKVAMPVPQKPVSMNSVDAVPGPSSMSEIRNAATKQVKCSTNQGIVDKNKCEFVSTDKTGSQAVVVQPIQKPPHLRSKKPLRRIKIEEFDSSSSSVGAGSSKMETTEPSIQQSPEVLTPQKTSNDSSLGERMSLVQKSGQHLPTGRAEEVASGDLQAQVPPVPVSSVQFLVGWNQVKGNSRLMYLFLKQICGAELPKLFQDSLESNILSSILLTLANQFAKEGSPVYLYLLGLSQVRRFTTLSLFLSKEEKDSVSKLLDHCLSCGECTESEATMLKERYEL